MDLASAAKKVFDLGFYTYILPSPPPGAHTSTMAFLSAKQVKSAKDLAWDIVCWLILTGGIFSRQALVFGNNGIGFDGTRITLSAFFASLCVGLALFALFMRWINRRKPQRGLLHVAVPYGFGFFAVTMVKGGTYAWKILCA